MTKLITLTAIRRRKPGGEPKEVQKIKAGTIVESGNFGVEELAYLKEAGALAVPGDDRASRFGFGPKRVGRVAGNAPFDLATQGKGNMAEGKPDPDKVFDDEAARKEAAAEIGAERAEDKAEADAAAEEAAAVDAESEAARKGEEEGEAQRLNADSEASAEAQRKAAEAEEAAAAGPSKGPKAARRKNAPASAASRSTGDGI